MFALLEIARIYKAECTRRCLCDHSRSFRPALWGGALRDDT